MHSDIYKNGSSNPVSMGRAFMLFWKNYVKFGGTSSRSEFWWWNLWNLIIRILIGILALASLALATQTPGFLAVTVLIYLASTALSLGMLLPQLSLSVRRLRDAGLSTPAICFLLIGSYLIAIAGIFFHPIWIISLGLAIFTFVMNVSPSKARFNQDR